MLIFKKKLTCLPKEQFDLMFKNGFSNSSFWFWI